VQVCMYVRERGTERERDIGCYDTYIKVYIVLTEQKKIIVEGGEKRGEEENSDQPGPTRRVRDDDNGARIA